MKQYISVLQWQKERAPITAGFCEMINDALNSNPSMSLAEFAELLDEENKRASVERLERIEREQITL